MTVQELISALQCLDPALPVLIRGYESGQNSVKQVIVREYHDNPDGKAWYYGDYATTETLDVDEVRSSPFRAVEFVAWAKV
tara:strand:- start:246 stop:488 length:243 start_codon:yes stop_codon:yes gene_type:complete